MSDALSPEQIDNTDAEGRLTLADALWYAQNKCQAEAMVDIATLTGACMIALGKQVQGPFRMAIQLQMTQIWCFSLPSPAAVAVAATV